MWPLGTPLQELCYCRVMEWGCASSPSQDQARGTVQVRHPVTQPLSFDSHLSWVGERLSKGPGDRPSCFRTPGAVLCLGALGSGRAGRAGRCSRRSASAGNVCRSKGVASGRSRDWPGSLLDAFQINFLQHARPSRSLRSPAAFPTWWASSPPASGEARSAREARAAWAKDGGVPEAAAGAAVPTPARPGQSGSERRPPGLLLGAPEPSRAVATSRLTSRDVPPSPLGSEAEKGRPGLLLQGRQRNLRPWVLGAKSALLLRGGSGDF